MDSIVINWADSEEDWDNIISTIKEHCGLEDAGGIAMRIVRDFGYKRKDALIPNPSTEYRLTVDLYKDLYDLCQCEDCKNGCQLMQEPDGTYYFQITGQCFSDTRTGKIIGCDTVKIYFQSVCEEDIRRLYMNVKLTKEELFNKAQERFNSWAKMYSDPNVTVQQMYEDMSCSCYSGDAGYDKITNDKPVLDPDLCFSYRGYQFELSSCNNITCKDQIIGVTDENFLERFQHGIFTDRYVCWIYGHKDYEGRTKEESDEPEYWAPEIYLVNTGWSWGAECDLNPGNVVDSIILGAIDKFLETFKE